MWMVEVTYFTEMSPSSHFSSIYVSIQNASKMRLSLGTKFHARVYFDEVLKSSPGIPLERYAPILVASMALAIKVRLGLCSFTKVARFRQGSRLTSWWARLEWWWCLWRSLNLRCTFLRFWITRWGSSLQIVTFNLFWRVSLTFKSLSWRIFLLW